MIDDNIIPYLPIYCRPPNKLLRYELRPFTEPTGKSGLERVAIFLIGGKGDEKEMTAQVMWDK